MANMNDYLRKALEEVLETNYTREVRMDLRDLLAKHFPAHQVRAIMYSVVVRPSKEGSNKCEVVVLGNLHPDLRLAVMNAASKIPDVTLRLPKNPAHHAVDTPSPDSTTPPQFGERILLLILRTKEERANIPGDLEEEFRGIAAKHGARYAKIWYYKQVTASAWPMVRKAVRWGALASVGEWIRRII